LPGGEASLRKNKKAVAGPAERKGLQSPKFDPLNYGGPAGKDSSKDA